MTGGIPDRPPNELKELAAQAGLEWDYHPNFGLRLTFEGVIIRHYPPQQGLSAETRKDLYVFLSNYQPCWDACHYSCPRDQPFCLVNGPYHPPLAMLGKLVNFSGIVYEVIALHMQGERVELQNLDNDTDFFFCDTTALAGTFVTGGCRICGNRWMMTATELRNVMQGDKEIYVDEIVDAEYSLNGIDICPDCAEVEVTPEITADDVAAYLREGVTLALDKLDERTDSGKLFSAEHGLTDLHTLLLNLLNASYGTFKQERATEAIKVYQDRK